MQIPKLLRKTTWIFLVLFLLSFTAIPFVESTVTGDFSPDPSHLPLPILVLTVLTILFFVAMIGSLIGAVVFRTAENAGLRKFGQRATAKILAVRETGERDNYRDRKSVV